MCEALDDHEGSVSIWGWLITNFRFADDIVVNAEVEEEGGSQQNPECNWSAWWSPNHGKEMETQMVWPHLKILGHGEDNSAGDSERSKKERKTEEEMGRKHQGMDGNGVGDSLRAVEDREGWKGIVATSTVVPQRPPRLRDWDEMRWCFYMEW